MGEGLTTKGQVCIVGGDGTAFGFNCGGSYMTYAFVKFHGTIH